MNHLSSGPMILGRALPFLVETFENVQLIDYHNGNRLTPSLLLAPHRGSRFPMLILGGSASQPLAEKVAKELGQEAGRLEIKRFPDGEKYLRIHDDVKDQDVAAIQSLYRTPDENIFELLLLTDTLRDLGA